MKYYIAYDGGGSKLASILFDENYKKINFAVSGSMNTGSTTGERVEEHTRECCEKLLEGTDVKEIECVYGVFSWIVRDVTKKCLNVKKTDDRGGEGLLGNLSAFITGNSVIALSGTGSVIFSNDPERPGEAGGYGSLINDEGSGYDMGRMAFAAAIRDFEKRAPHTLISDCICKKFGVDDIPSAASKCFEIPGKSTVTAVASAAECVGEAARMGDEVAIGLLKKCGAVMADQALGLIKRLEIPVETPVVITGGHFKNDHRIVDEFTRIIKEYQPEREVVIPYFEPLIGAVMAHAYFHGVPFDDEFKAMMKEEYKDHRYIIK
ncbi:MAG: hypothetical protein IJT91_06245 [Clostridia bacterium]|nr:hypothetical protein [Clostridia bacterium]